MDEITVDEHELARVEVGIRVEVVAVGDDPEAGFGATADTLPALRSVAARPEDFSPSASLNAILAAPDQRSDTARALLATQPMIASHPLVAARLDYFCSVKDFTSS